MGVSHSSCWEIFPFGSIHEFHSSRIIVLMYPARARAGITPVPYNEIGESICELKIEAQDG